MRLRIFWSSVSGTPAVAPNESPAEPAAGTDSDVQDDTQNRARRGK